MLLPFYRILRYREFKRVTAIAFYRSRRFRRMTSIAVLSRWLLPNVPGRQDLPRRSERDRPLIDISELVPRHLTNARTTTTVKVRRPSSWLAMSRHEDLARFARDHENAITSVARVRLVAVRGSERALE
jgi:hypothetical protein